MLMPKQEKILIFLHEMDANAAQILSVTESSTVTDAELCPTVSVLVVNNMYSY